MAKRIPRNMWIVIIAGIIIGSIVLTLIENAGTWNFPSIGEWDPQPIDFSEPSNPNEPGTQMPP